MEVRPPLHINDRATLIDNAFQRVERLTLTEPSTFHSTILHGFSLLSGKNGVIENQPVTVTSLVSTDTLIVVTTRAITYVAAEEPSRPGQTVLLLTLTHDQLSTENSGLLRMLGTARADLSAVYNIPEPAAPEQPIPPVAKRRKRSRNTSPNVGPDGERLPSRTDKARQVKAAKRAALLNGTAQAPTTTPTGQEASQKLGQEQGQPVVPPKRSRKPSPAQPPATEPARTEPDVLASTPPVAEPAASETAGMEQRPGRAPRATTTRSSSPRANSTPVSSPRATRTKPIQPSPELPPVRSTLQNPAAETRTLPASEATDPTELAVLTPEPVIMDLPIVPIERRSTSPDNLRRIENRAKGQEQDMPPLLEDLNDDLTDDVPF